MRLATAPQRNSSARQGVEVEEARALAVRMAVLAQTHIAYRQYAFARQQFNRANELYRIETELAEENRVRQNASVGNEVDRIVSDTSAILAEVRLYQAYATLISSYDAINATVGDDSELSTYIAENQKRLSVAIEDIATAEETIQTANEAKADLAKAISELEREADKLVRDRKKLDARMTRLVSRHDAASSTLKALSQELDALPEPEDGDKSLERTSLRLEQKIASAQNALTDLDAEIAQTNALMEGNSVAQSNIAAQIEDKSKRQVELDNEVAASTSALLDAQARKAYYE
jgi:chromosome segregation ATPase